MPLPDTVPDPELRRDDAQAAFGEQLVALQPRLRAFVRDLLRGEARPHASVDDVVQEAIARAWRSRERYDASRGELAPWLLRISFRAFLDERGRRPPAEALDQPLRDSGPGPAEHASARERAADLLALLTAREREVLLRFHRDGETIRAIAAALGAAEGTVKSLLHRARERLWTDERDRRQEDS